MVIGYGKEVPCNTGKFIIGRSGDMPNKGSYAPQRHKEHKEKEMLSSRGRSPEL
jgi:hypothetical protein